MGMTFKDANITEDYILTNVELYFKGDLKGYVGAMLYNKQSDREYEVLYRVCDPANGEEYTLVSIDYGWEIKDEIFNAVEKYLTGVIKNTNHARLYDETL